MKLLLLLLLPCALSFGIFRPPVDKTIDKVEDSSKHRIGKLTSEEKANLSKEWGMDLEVRKARLDRISSKVAAKATSNDKVSVKHRIKNFPTVTVNKPSEKVITDLIKVNEETGVADYLFEGDLILTESQLEAIESGLIENKRRKRQVSKRAQKWPNNTVYFYFDESIGGKVKTIVQKAQTYLQAHTCINYVEDKTAVNRIKVYKGSGCSSFLGMKSGEQPMSMGSSCGVIGTAFHELIHALGVIHTQSRSDRDTYVDLDLSKVQKSKLKNFVKASEDENILFTPYEYGSIMHYAADAGTGSSHSLSIIPKDEAYTYTLGNRQISFYDILMINDYYNCNATCAVENSAVCKNGGYPNPRNCAECNCPRGYGGLLCDERPPGCGETLEATEYWESARITAGEPFVFSDEFMECNNWIKAPEGKQVQVKLVNMYGVECEYGCPYNGIEIKANANALITNPLYCCQESVIVTSELNPTPVVAFSRERNSFAIEYRFVEREVKPTTEPTPATKQTSSSTPAEPSTKASSTEPTTTTSVVKTTTTSVETTTPAETTTKPTSAAEITTQPTTPEATTTKPTEKPTTTAPLPSPTDSGNLLNSSMVVLKRLVNDQTQQHKYHSNNTIINNWVSEGYRINGQIGKVVDINIYKKTPGQFQSLCPSLVKLHVLIYMYFDIQYMTIDEGEAISYVRTGYWKELQSVGYCSTSKACGAKRNLRSVSSDNDIIYSTYDKQLKTLNDWHDSDYYGSLSGTICWLF